MPADVDTSATTTSDARPTRRRAAPLSAVERREILDALLLRTNDGWLFRFAFLMTMSVVIASLGLLQNSAAVVIGAMLIAPLMSPLLGVAASMVMGWGGRIARGGALVLAATVGTVGIAWLIARVMPIVSQSLPNEVVSRSSPDIRDLLIALAAGATGAYATARRDQVSALPGVAVAVALVPPLASVGVLLGLGQPDLASGAALLYLTNLVGIIVAAMVVFLAVGFVPAARLRTAGIRVISAAIIVLVLLLALGSVLTTRLVSSAAAARRLQRTTEDVVDWLGPGRSEDLGRIQLKDDRVWVDINSEQPPPATESLSSALSTSLHRQVQVVVRWTPTRSPTASTTTVPQIAVEVVQPLVEKWLHDEPQTRDLVVTRISLNGQSLQVDVEGPNAPGSTKRLSELMAKAFGFEPQIAISWTDTGDAK